MHDPRESFRPSPPVILDFDGSVLPVAEGERRIPLGSWQEAIRFGCTRRAFSALEAHLEGVLLWIAAVRSWAAATSTTSR